MDHTTDDPTKYFQPALFGKLFPGEQYTYDCNLQPVFYEGNWLTVNGAAL